MKRFFYSIGIILLCTFMVLGFLLALARSSRIQTAAIGVLTKHLSEGLRTHVSVGRMDYQFPNSLLIEDIYVEDQMADTLLFVDTLQARFDFLALRDNRVSFRSALLKGVRAYAHMLDGDSVANYQFLVDAFSSPSDGETHPFPITLEVKNVSLEDARLQYCDWWIRSLSAGLSLHSLSADSLNAEIERLTLRLTNSADRLKGQEFALTDLRAHLIATDSLIEMPVLRMETPRSLFSASVVRMAIPEDNLIADRLAHSEVAFRLEELSFTPSDIALFVPQLARANSPFSMTADLSGRVDSLHAADLSVTYEGQRILLGDITAYGLPNLDSLYVRATCEDLFVNKAVLQDIASDFTNRPIELPVLVGRLGAVHYRGTLEGPLDSLMLRGAFSSALGSLTTIGRFTTNSEFSEFGFVGDISTRRFALGRLLAESDLGNVAFTSHYNGHFGKEHPFHGTASLKVSELQYRQYTYQNFRLDGNFRDNIFLGDMEMEDPNLDFDFHGKIDLSHRTPEYAFALALHHLRLGDLHFSDKYYDADLRLGADIAISGNRLDNLRGAVHLDTVTFTHLGRSMTIQQFDFSAEPGLMAVRSDILTAQCSGQYTFASLPTTFRKIVAQYVPKVFTERARQSLELTQSANEMQFYFYFKRLDELCAVLDLPVSVPSLPTVKGMLNEPANQFALQAVVPEVRTANQFLEDVSLNIDNRNDCFNLAFYLLKHKNERSTADNQLGDIRFYTNLHAGNDSLRLSLDWANPDTLHNAGKVQIHTRFAQYEGQPIINTHILPTSILLNDTVWQLGNSYVTYVGVDTTLQIERFFLGSESQYISVDGLASPREEDALRVKLHEIDLDYFLEWTDVKNSITFGGRISGWAKLYDLFTQPKFEAEVAMDHAALNGYEIGDVRATASLDPDTKAVLIAGDVTEHFPSFDKRVAHVDGLVEGGNWGLDIQTDSISLAFINGWTDGILSDLSGRVQGQVNVGGDPTGAVFVTCAANVIEASVTIPYTGATYTFSDSAFMDSTAIRFPNIHLHDKEGNMLLLNGVITHDIFRDFAFNLAAKSDRAIVLDLPAGDYYGGKVYAAADVQIEGDERAISIRAYGKTKPGSQFISSITSASTASSSDFIHFIDHQLEQHEEIDDEGNHLNHLANHLAERGTDLSLILQIEATPDVLARLILDDRTGDELRGYGSGNLQLRMNNDALSFHGQYTIESGKLNFTFQNLIRREFEIAAGSTVTWTGDVESPQLDVHAVYHTTASLRDLFGADAANVTNRSTVPVNCLLSMSGTLEAPVISFGIELPQSDEAISSQVKSIVNTEDMLIRQVLYLLVFNRFYMPEYLQTASNTGINETYSLLSSTVTGQINSWISRLTDVVSVGFNIRQDGQGKDASQEYETQFEIHPVQGLVINGNLGYRYNDIANQPFFGNLDVEYMLTQNGKLRAKAYTHTVDKYSLRQATTVQGLGLIFKHDFNIVDPLKRAKSSADSTLATRKK